MIGFTLHTLGELCIAIAVLLVHKKVMDERKIDKKVIQNLNLEQHLSLLGIIAMIAGYVLELYQI